MRMILSDIGKVLWKALSAVVTATSNIAFCAGGLVVGIIGEILFGMLSIMDNIFEYMVETYINGNHSTLRRLYHELNKEARKDFIGFLLVECPPQYHTEILQEIV